MVGARSAKNFYLKSGLHNTGFLLHFCAALGVA
jgi:hypothetical protein